MSIFSPRSIDLLLRPLGARKDALNIESHIEPIRRIPFQGFEITGVYFVKSTDNYERR